MLWVIIRSVLVRRFLEMNTHNICFCVEIFIISTEAYVVGSKWGTSNEYPQHMKKYVVDTH